MKSKKELNALKKEVVAVTNQLAELSDDELEQVTGGQNLYIFLVGVKDPDGQNHALPNEK